MQSHKTLLTGKKVAQVFDIRILKNETNAILRNM